jgi:hypothetical protein
MLSKCYYKLWVHFLGISCNTWKLVTRGRVDEPACSYSQWLACWKVRFLQGFSFFNCILAYHMFSSNWVFLLWIAYLHITLFSWNSTHGTHHPDGISTIWNSLDYSFLHNCEELSSNSEKCVFLIPLTSYEDPTCNCMRFHFQRSPELCRTPEIKRSASSTCWIP